MAAGKLEWIFGLLDKTSGPATAIEKKLALVEHRLKMVDKASSAATTDRQRDALGTQKLKLGMQSDALKMSAADAAAGGFLLRLNAALAVVGFVASAIRSVVGVLFEAAGATANLAFQFGKHLAVLRRLARAVQGYPDAAFHNGERRAHLVGGVRREPALPLKSFIESR